jgi:hypothetical protein
MNEQESYSEAPLKEAIENECAILCQTLLRKNALYGNSAMQSPILAPYLTESGAIAIRLSDKINRLVTLQTSKVDDKEESISDTLLDIAGYCLLWRIASYKD